MRVLYIHQYFVPPDGSGGTRSYEMARRLVRAGHDVTVLTSSAFFPTKYRFNGDLSTLSFDGVRVRVVDVPYSNAMSYRDRIVAFLKFAVRGIRIALQSRDVDVVFATSTPLTVVLPAIAAKVRNRCPMVFEVRDLWPAVPIAMGALRNPVARWAARILEWFAYRNAASIVALSEGMREGVVATGVKADRVTVIPNSANPSVFSVSSDDGRAYVASRTTWKSGPLVVYTGTLGAVNGLSYMVDIARAMLDLDSEVGFLIAGDGRERAKIEERARSLGVLDRNLWMMPPVAKADVPKLLAASTLASSFVVDVPELAHNSANKFFDALAASRPILINHRGWQADLLEKTGAGIVVPPNDSVAAARQIEGFLQDRQKVARARDAAALLAAGPFNVENLAADLERVLRAAAASARP